MMPIVNADRVFWIEPAGYTVARSRKPDSWPPVPALYDFDLDVRNARVRGKAYLPYT